MLALPYWQIKVASRLGYTVLKILNTEQLWNVKVIQNTHLYQPLPAEELKWLLSSQPTFHWKVSVSELVFRESAEFQKPLNSREKKQL